MAYTTDSKPMGRVLMPYTPISFSGVDYNDVSDNFVSKFTEKS